MTGRVAIVTGAAGGIGRALTADLLKAGATVWALDLSEEGLAAMKAEADKQGRELRTLRLDVTDSTAVEDVAAEVHGRDGRIDYWFNNAGIAATGWFGALSPAEFERVMRINFMAVATGTRVALKYMEEHGRGSIVNIASVAGHIPSPWLVAYSASKHAVVGFTRSLREEMRLRDSNVKLVLVSPGFVDTAMISRNKAKGFPEWLSFLLSTPDTVSREILRGVERGTEEIYPALNGRMMMRMHRYMPKGLLRRSSRMLLADSFKDFVLNRYRVE